MAGFKALAAVGLSIEALLSQRFRELPPPPLPPSPVPPPAPPRPPTATLVTADEFDRNGKPGQGIQRPGVSIYFYRLSLDRESRAAWSAVTAGDGIPRVPLRMHFLVTAWAGSAQVEMELLGLAAQTLERQSILAGPLLDRLGEWRPGETVQVVLDELALDSMSEAFQALTTDYRLCLPYVARVVVIEHPPVAVVEPVASVGRAVRAVQEFEQVGVLP